MVAAGWSEGQKRAYVLADNKLTLNAGWDNDLLKVELGELKGTNQLQRLRRCQVGEFYLSIEAVCRRPSVTKSIAYARAHESKTTSKSVILGQRDNAISFHPCSHLQHLQCSTGDDRTIGYVSTSVDPKLQALGAQFARVG
jgi:hypothetical protein